MDDACNRCGRAGDLLALHRFGDNPRTLTTEFVCKGCCRKVEELLASGPDERELMAFALEMVDGFERLCLQHRLARPGDKFPAHLPEFLGVSDE
jgi:hypothetical protein